MPSFQGLFRVIRENPKKIVFFGGVSYLVVDYAITRWRRTLHREAFCQEAKHYGQMCLHEQSMPRKMFVLLHPRAGAGENRSFFDKEVGPIFHLAGIDFDVRRIKHTEEVRDVAYMEDLSSYDDVVIVGGDGFFQEAVSGLLQRPDAAAVQAKGLGLVPVGNSNNLYRNKLTSSAATDRSLLVHEAALGIVEARKTSIDSIRIQFDDTELPSYAFTGVGWGMFGGAARRGQIRRWPDQSRADLAALVGLTWDHSKTTDCEGVVEYTANGQQVVGEQRHHPAVLATILPTWASGSRLAVDEAPANGMSLIDLDSSTSTWQLLRRVRQGRVGLAFATPEETIPACQTVAVRPVLPPFTPSSTEEAGDEGAEIEEPSPHHVPLWIDGTNYFARPCVLSYVPGCLQVYTASKLLVNSK